MQINIKNQNRRTCKNTFKKIFNLALLSLGIIAWSCSTTETTESIPRVDRIELYESRVPLIFTGTNAEGQPAANLLLSGFVKYPSDGRLLNFTVTNNPYLSIETDSTDLFEYSMLQVQENVIGSTNIFVGVNLSLKDNPAVSTNLTVISLSRDMFFRNISSFNFAGLNRRLVSGGCQVKFGLIADGKQSIFAFSFYANFQGRTNNNNLADIYLIQAGLDGFGVPGINYESSTSILSNQSMIINGPTEGVGTITPGFSWYSSFTFTFPSPTDPDYSSIDNVVNATPLQFLASSTTEQILTPHIDYNCNIADEENRISYVNLN